MSGGDEGGTDGEDGAIVKLVNMVGHYMVMVGVDCVATRSQYGFKGAFIYIFTQWVLVVVKVVGSVLFFVVSLSTPLSTDN